MGFYVLGVKRDYYKRLDPISFYTDKKFVQRYRLSKEVVRVIVKHYVSTQEVKIKRGRYAISHRLSMCLALRYFATGANFLTIADCHGVSKATVSRAVKSVSTFFRNNITDYVKWPDTTNAKANNACKFYKKGKKPRCFGLVDGTHVPIACPRGVTVDENQFFCYKGYYSLNTMIICDFDCVIFHVDASNPGSCNDIYAMNGSQVKDLGDRGDFHGFYLLGDSGYVLTDWLLTPVRKEENEYDVRYNKWQKKTRSKVERTIGQVKQRWRCLDTSGGYLFHHPHRAGCIIESCVCLHNCAKVGQVKLLKDFPSKDGFRAVQDPVEQPDTVSRKAKQKFENLRKSFIKEYFKPTEEQEAEVN